MNDPTTSNRSRVLGASFPAPEHQFHADRRLAGLGSSRRRTSRLARLGVTALFAVSVATAVDAQEKLTENTFKKVEMPPVASIDDFGFLAGVWRGTGMGGEVEETWTEPLAGSMVGTFKLVQGGEASFYELMVIAERGHTVDLRLKHFNADMTGWEEKDSFLTFSLVGVAENEARFGGLTYRLTDDDRLEVYLAMRRGGESHEVAFTFERQSPAASSHGQVSSHDSHGRTHDMERGRGHGEDHTMAHSTANHRFTDAERWTEVFDDPERDAWQKPAEVMRLMEIESGMVVADIGAGTGYFMEHLSHEVGERGRAIGLDIEPAMVDFMRERMTRESWSNAEAREIAADASDLDANSLDRVLIVNTWHHISARQDYSATLKKALKPGGRVYVVDFTKETSHGPPPAHRLYAEEVVAELEAGGLEAEIIKESLPEQYIVVGRR